LEQKGDTAFYLSPFNKACDDSKGGKQPSRSKTNKIDLPRLRSALAIHELLASLEQDSQRQVRTYNSAAQRLWRCRIMMNYLTHHIIGHAVVPDEVDVMLELFGVLVLSTAKLLLQLEGRNTGDKSQKIAIML
jgi:hypothetical protein